ncbi:hypothetical protein ACFPRL_13335 [Pseudoclavibacter helvolus]
MRLLGVLDADEAATARLAVDLGTEGLFVASKAQRNFEDCDGCAFDACGRLGRVGADLRDLGDARRDDRSGCRSRRRDNRGSLGDGGRLDNRDDLRGQRRSDERRRGDDRSCLSWSRCALSFATGTAGAECLRRCLWCASCERCETLCFAEFSTGHGRRLSLLLARCEKGSQRFISLPRFITNW